MLPASTERVPLRGATPEPGRSRHPLRRRTRDQDRPAVLRTIDQRRDTRHRPRLRTEQTRSPVAQFGLSPAPDILPGNAGRFSGHRSTGAALDFSSPGRFDSGNVFAPNVIQARQQLGGHVGALVDGQRQRFSKKFLRSRGHVAILDPAGQPNKRLHQSVAPVGCVFSVQPLVSRDRWADELTNRLDDSFSLFCMWL